MPAAAFGNVVREYFDSVSRFSAAVSPRRALERRRLGVYVRAKGEGRSIVRKLRRIPDADLNEASIAAQVAQISVRSSSVPRVRLDSGSCSARGARPRDASRVPPAPRLPGPPRLLANS